MLTLAQELVQSFYDTAKEISFHWPPHRMIGTPKKRRRDRKTVVMMKQFGPKHSNVSKLSGQRRMFEV